MQLLCYVIFFDILHRYGVIAASQICSVSRKYCAVLRNRFFVVLLCCRLPPKLGETAKVYRYGINWVKGRGVILEIVYVGQCEVFVCLDFVVFFFLSLLLVAKLIGPRMGCQFLKKFDFSDTLPLSVCGSSVG